MTRDRWREIRDAIEQDIRMGVLEPGAKLPTEPQMARVYDAGRHSIRKAVSDLAVQGLVSVEQGRGTFVQARPRIAYPIGQRTRLRDNMAAQGLTVTSEGVEIIPVSAPAHVAKALALQPGAEVLQSSRTTLADGVPMAHGMIWHDLARFPDIAARRRDIGSLTAVYRSYGIEDYVRADTEIFSRPARGVEARALHQHPDMPVMVVRATDALPDGTPIAHSEVIWSAARVVFTVGGAS